MEYQVEDWHKIETELLELFKLHGEEFNKTDMPTNPDLITYRNLNDCGALQVVTARKEGILAGYALCFVFGHLHHCVKICHVDTLFLKKEYRTGRKVIDFPSQIIEIMKHKSVEMLYIGARSDGGYARVLEYLGFEKTEQIYARRING